MAIFVRFKFIRNNLPVVANFSVEDIMIGRFEVVLCGLADGFVDWVGSGRFDDRVAVEL